ncbi:MULTISPECIES: hypothetical protein [Clostridium]|uniref:ABC-2 family transporter protein n=1 Tax=Clostridium cibarium TaxID=2762247 RepID=A0ABR8PR76_9CLOT|nr:MULTISPECIES: hypothetical protein [Clostridium]MBD7910678.1 hypothetical protein [Clostridium cibarium]
MLKNEIIKFFTTTKWVVYFSIIAAITIITSVFLNLGGAQTENLYVYFYKYTCNTNIYIIPIMIAIIVSDIFTDDYISGNLKFFNIYLSKISIFINKLFMIFIVTLFLIFSSGIILTIVYLIIKGEDYAILKNEIYMIVNLNLTLFVGMLPVIFIYVLISVKFDNSMIISIATFILLIAIDYFFRAYYDITPISILRDFILISTNKYVLPSDKFHILLLLIYILILFPVALKSFSKKEMIY